MTLNVQEILKLVHVFKNSSENPLNYYEWEYNKFKEISKSKATLDTGMAHSLPWCHKWWLAIINDIQQLVQNYGHAALYQLLYVIDSSSQPIFVYHDNEWASPYVL